MRFDRRAIGCCLLLPFAGIPAAAQDRGGPQAPEARARFERGIEIYRARDYQAAIGELRAGYENEPWPGFLFAWAQAERLRGDCAAAVDLYERFLATGPPATQAAHARENLDLCHPTSEREPAATGVAEPSRPVEPPRLPTRPVTSGSAESSAHGGTAPRMVLVSAWWNDSVGGLLVGAGLGAVGVGVAFYLVALGNRSDAEDAGRLSILEESLDDAERHLLFARIALAVGAAMVATGIVRYVLRGNRWAVERAASASAGRGPMLLVRF